MRISFPFLLRAGLILAGSALLVTSCLQGIEQPVQQGEVETVFLADPPVWGVEGTAVAPLTKTHRLANGNTAWSEGDVISIFQGNLTGAGGEKFSLESVSESGQARFIGNLTVAAGVMDEDAQSQAFWAVYPYDVNNQCDGKGVNILIGMKYTGEAGTFPNGAFPAVGTSSSLAFPFYNVCSGLVFTVSQEHIYTISLIGNKHEALGGTVRVEMGEDNRPTVVSVGAKLDSLVYRAPDKNGFVPGEQYFFPVMPVELSEGFTLRFTKREDGGNGEGIFTHAVYKSPAATTLKRSVFHAASNLDAGLDFAQKAFTEEEIAADLATVYDTFAKKAASKGSAFTYSPTRVLLNMCGDDVLAAGSSFGDQVFQESLNDFRYGTDNDVLYNIFKDYYAAIDTFNRLLDKYRGSELPAAKKLVAETRVLRAQLYFVLAAGWGTPPFVHSYDPAMLGNYPLADVLVSDPEIHMTQKEYFEWCANECEQAHDDLSAREGTGDQAGAYKVTSGFADALAGKAYLFAGNNAKAKEALQRVIGSGNYALVPGDKYWQNFHIEGDGNEEKIFEPNLEYKASVGMFDAPTTWMETNLWAWRSDRFYNWNAPHAVYTGGVGGWGALGVPQWFGDEFFANDGHSARFDATLMRIDDALFGMEYSNAPFNAMSREQKEASYDLGISEGGLYGQSFWLPFKQLVRSTDTGAYGNSTRLNNFTIMRYAEVLLLYAEACLQTGDNALALSAINQIQERAGSKTVSTTASMEVLRKEKAYELWMEGSRWFDLVRWNDTERVENAGKEVPVLYDKRYRAPQEGETITWENGDATKDRFYTVSTHDAVDHELPVGFKKGKHDLFPYPQHVLENNPDIQQNPGW